MVQTIKNSRSARVMFIAGMIMIGLWLAFIAVMALMIYLTGDAWAAIGMLILTLFSFPVICGTYTFILFIISLITHHRVNRAVSVLNIVGVAVYYILIVLLLAQVFNIPVLGKWDGFAGVMMYAEAAISVLGALAQVIVHAIRRKKYGCSEPSEAVCAECDSPVVGEANDDSDKS